MNRAMQSAAAPAPLPPATATGLLAASAPALQAAALELRGVSKSYGTGPGRTVVLEGVDLQVRRGEFVAIVGFSGSGKTTLISMLAGLTRADRGAVLKDGRPITGPGTD